MLGHDAPRGGADHAGGFHVRGFLDADHFGTDGTEVLRNIDHGDGDAGGEDAAPQAGLAVGDHDRHQNRQQQRREGVHGVGDHDEHTIDPSAEIAGDQAEQHACENRQQYRDDDGDDGGAGTPDHTAEHIVATCSGAPDVFGGRCRLGREGNAVGALELRVAVWRDERRENGDQQEERREHEARDQHAFLPADCDA